jgi:hypothetical protein
LSLLSTSPIHTFYTIYFNSPPPLPLDHSCKAQYYLQTSNSLIVNYLTCVIYVKALSVG